VVNPVVAASIVLVISVLPLSGQAVPRTVTGSVQDTTGRPLEGAVIVLNPLGAMRAARTDAAGRFRFDRVTPGRYTIRTTRIGSMPDERVITVPDEGLQVSITLTAIPYRMDTLTIVGRRTGIFGTTVYREDFRALGAVEVSVLGTGHRMRTSSDGKFSFGDVRPGGWVVKGRRDGFETTMFAVVVPDTAAVELAMAMDTIRTKAQGIANGRVQDMQMRINRMDRNASAIVVGQEFAAQRGQSLDIALRYSPSFLSKGLVLENVECIYINGLPRPNLLAKDIAADDVAMVEVYNYRGAVSYQDQQLFRNNGTACGAGPVQEVFGSRGSQLRSFRPPKPTTVAFILIWLK